MNIIAKIETKAAHLAQCVEHMKGGTCPLHIAAASPAVAPVKAKARKATRRAKPTAAPKASVLAPPPPITGVGVSRPPASRRTRASSTSAPSTTA